ncbi:MAG: hypothetical protein ABSF18_04885 [Gammaproteobacteria bacterium]
MFRVFEWKARIKQAITGADTALSEYKIELAKQQENDQVTIQGMFLAEFWEQYDEKDPMTAPAKVFQEVLNLIPIYPQLPQAFPQHSKLLFKTITAKNDNLMLKLKKAEDERKAQEERIKEQARARLAEEEQARKLAEEQARIAEAERARIAMEQQQREALLKEKAEKKEARKLQKAEEQQKRQEHEQAQRQADLARQQAEENQRRQAEAQRERERLELEKAEIRKANIERAKQKLAEKLEKEKEKKEYEALKKLEEEAARTKRNEELKPLRNAKKTLIEDASWQIKSFLELVKVYDETPNKPNGYFNSNEPQIIFLRTILYFIENHKQVLAGKNLEVILHEIAAQYQGSLEATSKDVGSDFSFLYKKEKIRPAQTICVETQTLPKRTFTSFTIPAQYYPSVNVQLIMLQMLVLALYSCVTGYILNRFLGWQPWHAYTGSTSLLATVYAAGKWKQSKVQQQKFAALNSAQATLAQSKTWDPHLFTKVVEELLKVDEGRLQYLTLDNVKINFLKNVLKFHVKINEIYSHLKPGKVKKIDKKLFTTTFNELIMKIDKMPGLAQAANGTLFLLGEMDDTVIDISTQGRLLNNYILNLDPVRKTEDPANPDGDEILNIIKKGGSSAEIYEKLYTREQAFKSHLKMFK